LVIWFVVTQALRITRKKTGRSFQYFLDGLPIRDKKESKYLDSLRVPPAWDDVHIAVSKHARILATGKDNAGRIQYIYNPTFRAKQEQDKFERILRFARALPKMRRTTFQHLRHEELDREKVLACVVRLMDQAYFRVGNDQYARENNSYGLTTIRSKHVSVHGDTITFDYIGKSGQKRHRNITDKQLSRIIKKLDDLPGYEVFKFYDKNGVLKDVKSKDVNAYIKEVMGDEFSAKDFRTWAGTLLTSAQLAEVEQAMSERERKKAVTTCIKNVAKKLGNTPAIARSSYIDPRIINAFVTSDDLKKVRETVKNLKRTPYFSTEEQCVLKLLESAPS
jgi:DNA topoisomerase I